MHALDVADSKTASLSGEPPRHYYPLGTSERHRIDDQLARAKEMELELRRNKEAQKGCRFHPRTNPTLAATHDSAEASAAPVQAASVFDRLRQQAQAREERRQQREEERLVRESHAQQRAFKPAINRNTAHEGNLKHLEDIPVEERLLFYGQAVARSAELRRQQRQRQEAERTNNTHGAATDPAERRKAQAAFNERNAQLLLQREWNRQAAEQAAAEQMTFKPKISATSAVIDAASRQRSSVTAHATASGHSSVSRRPVEHSDFFSSAAGSEHPTASSRHSEGHQDRGTLLYERGIEQQKQRLLDQERNQLRESVERNNCNQPRTNPLSDAWIEHGQHRDLFRTDFVKRQELYQAARQEELEELARRQEQQAAAVGNVGSLEAARQVTAGEVEEQVDRLYYKRTVAEAEKRAKTLSTVQASECPFRPQLSTGTRHVLRKLDGTREKNFVLRLAVDSNSNRMREEGAGREESAGRAANSLYEPPNGQQPHKRWNSSPARPPQPADEAPDRTARRQQQRGPSPSPAPPLRRDAIVRFYERQLLSIQAKAEKVRLVQQKDLVESMAECTFRPKTTAALDRRSGGGGGAGRGDGAPVENSVSGVQQYLERRALVFQQKEELAEKRRTMGQPAGGASAARTANGNTVVRPFQLQTELRHSPARDPRRGRGNGAVSGPGARQPSLFALDTGERGRVLANESRQYRDALEDYGGSAYDNDDYEDEDSMSAGSEFEIHQDPSSISTRWDHPSVSGGEACYPRSRSASQQQQQRQQSPALSGPRKTAPRHVASALREPSPRVPAGHRSVSFVGLSSKGPPVTAAHRDPYEMSSLLLTRLRQQKRA